MSQEKKDRNTYIDGTFEDIKKLWGNILRSKQSYGCIVFKLLSFREIYLNIYRGNAMKSWICFTIIWLNREQSWEIDEIGHELCDGYKELYYSTFSPFGMFEFFCNEMS